MNSTELLEVLACVRKANEAADAIQKADDTLTGEQRGTMLSTIRVELSVAAGKIAQRLEEIPVGAGFRVLEGGGT